MSIEGTRREFGPSLGIVISQAYCTLLNPVANFRISCFCY